MTIAKTLYDHITDEMLRTPVGELDPIDAKMIQVVLNGPHASDLIERMNQLAEERQP